jgi:L,D-transpeptidase catalytic domain
MKLRIGLLAAVLSLLCAAGSFASGATAASLSPEAWSSVELNGLDPRVLALALQSAAAAVGQGAAVLPSTLTVIDYSKPSTEPRLWVFDVRTHELLFHELVSHGRGSGKTMATEFSNTAESNMTSLGLFRTAEAYTGHNGYSLRLDGLEKGTNDNARDRAIVIHGAPYVNAATAKANGYLGRSLGCPAVRPEVAQELIDAVKGGGLLFAYYPDQAWLQSSQYLHGTTP